MFVLDSASPNIESTVYVKHERNYFENVPQTTEATRYANTSIDVNFLLTQSDIRNH